MACHQAHPAFDTCSLCEFDPFVRNHFFTGKMMGAGEFSAETRYHGEKLRHHNVRLHGWGVVCGLEVLQHPSIDCRKRYVVVSPGSALDCCGHEILVVDEETVDVGQHPDVLKLARDSQRHTLQVCVRQRECPTEEVPVLYDECGCDDSKCAPNRILESFQFEVRVDPPLSRADLAGAPALGAFSTSTLHGVTGFEPAAAGKVVVVDPADAARVIVVDPGRRSMQSVSLPARARALALARAGDLFYVVTDTSDANARAEVHVYRTADGSEVPPAAAVRKVPGTTAASVLMAVTTTHAQRALAVLDQATGNLHVWRPDAAHGIEDAPQAPVALIAGLGALTARADGTAGYAIHAATDKVKRWDFAAAPANVAGLPAGVAALAAFDLGTDEMLAAAVPGETRLYVVNLTTPAAAPPPLDLQHPPLFVGAVVDPDGVWLHVLETEGGHAWVQGVFLPAAGAPPLVSAARAADGGSGIVLLFGQGQAGLLDLAAVAQSDCADHLWKQLKACPGCDEPDCVVLATLTNYRPGAEILKPGEAPADATIAPARIDNRMGRRMLASTATLQAWLQCLHLKGGVPGPAGPAGNDGRPGLDGNPGADGLGLYPDLPKILDIGWRHEDQVPITRFMQIFAGLYDETTGAINRAAVEKRLLDRQDIPPFTLYFNQRMTGVTVRTMSVAFDIPMVTLGNNNVPLMQGVYWPIDLRMFGEIVPVQAAGLTTPHTAEGCPFAACFMPRYEFFSRNGQMAWPLFLVWYLTLVSWAAGQPQPGAPPIPPERRIDLLPVVRIELKGEFVYAPGVAGAYSQLAVLDGDNVGGRVGLNEVRGGDVLGGKNPSGNLTQGGRFESWFMLTGGDPIATGPMSNAVRTVAAALDPERLFAAVPTPIVADFATEDTLAAAGVRRALARKIVAERRKAPFKGTADFRRRLSLSDDDWKSVKDRLFIP